METNDFKDYNILHHGAINGVTGSCHQLMLADHSSILIDCGLFQGDETSLDDSDETQLAINFPIDNIRALVVSHVHIDHVGRIPYLLAAGFKGPIYCSEASALLLPVVLEDAIKIAFTRSTQMLEKFDQQIKKRIISLKYNQWVTVDAVKNDTRKSSSAWLNRSGCSQYAEWPAPGTTHVSWFGMRAASISSTAGGV